MQLKQANLKRNQTEGKGSNIHPDCFSNAADNVFWPIHSFIRKLDIIKVLCVSDFLIP